MNKAEAALLREFDQAVWPKFSETNTQCTNPQGKTLGGLRRVFLSTAALSAIAREAKKRRGEHRHVFLARCYNDSLRLLHSIIHGNDHAYHYFIRNQIENIWCHLFYRDHPVDFEWLAHKNKRATMEELKEYCQELSTHSHSSQSLLTLQSQYSKLCKMVHTQSETPKSIAWHMSALTITDDSLAAISKSGLAVFTNSIIVLSAIEDPALFASLHPNWIAIIRKLLGHNRTKFTIGVI